MRPLLISLVILTSACFPPRDFDCATEGGLYVKGGDCAAVYPVQQEIEHEAEAMGLGTHTLQGLLLWARRDLDSTGSFQGDSGPVAGLSYCQSGMMIVAIQGENWRHSAMVHEGFHMAQFCRYDESIYSECVQTGGDAASCDFKAAHPHWDKDVYPVISKITRE